MPCVFALFAHYVDASLTTFRSFTAFQSRRIATGSFVEITSLSFEGRLHRVLLRNKKNARNRDWSLERY